MTENFINASDEIARQKDYSRKMGDWVKEARDAGKVYCQRCAKLAHDSGTLTNWEDYIAKDEIRRVDVKEKNKITGESIITGYLVDYKCPRGHGVSATWDKGEIPEKKK